MQNKEEKFSVTNTTRSKTPRVDFLNMKNAALGKDYSLSLVFVGNSTSAKLNNSYRGKNNPTNVLSFPLDKKNGEIFICMPVAKREAPEFGRKLDNFIAFLFIHGLMHLKGHDHGDTMDRAETKLRKRFSV